MAGDSRGRYPGRGPSGVAAAGGRGSERLSRPGGREAAGALKLIEEARRLEQAGADMLLLEAVASEVAREIANRTQLPVIGCVSGPHCDGTVVVLHDMLAWGRGTSAAGGQAVCRSVAGPRRRLLALRGGCAGRSLSDRAGCDSHEARRAGEAGGGVAAGGHGEVGRAAVEDSPTTGAETAHRSNLLFVQAVNIRVCGQVGSRACRVNTTHRAVRNINWRCWSKSFGK